MINNDIFNLAIKSYETKFEHAKTSLKLLFTNPNNIETVNGSIDLRIIDEILNNCINYEQKISFLRENKHILLQKDLNKSDNIQKILPNQDKIQKKENNINIKIEKNNKNDNKNDNDNDIEIIDKPCNCNCKCNIKS